MRTEPENVLTFDFVANDELRELLISDYREMVNNLGVGSWKSAQALAGSIVEAMLLDWLEANNVKEYDKKPLLELDLTNIIKACRQKVNGKTLISETAEHYSGVVKGYRNLIHAGRVLREKKQDEVNEETANIAKQLVGLLAKEIARLRSVTHRDTAEQVLKKLAVDPEGCLATLSYLLPNMQESDKEKLLLKFLPKRNLDISNDLDNGHGLPPEMWDDLQTDLKNTKACFRAVFKGASEATKRKAMANYLTVLKTGSQPEREAYESELLYARDLEYCPADTVPMIVGHLLRKLAQVNSNQSIQRYNGIGKYIPEESISSYFTGMVKIVHGNIGAQKGDSYNLRVSAIEQMTTTYHHGLGDKQYFGTMYLESLLRRDITDEIREVIKSVIAGDDIPF